MTRLAVGRVQLLDVGRTALVLAVAIVAASVLVLLSESLETVEMVSEPFDILDDRIAVPAMLAALLLAASALLALWLAGTSSTEDGMRWRWRVVGCVLMLMAIEVGIDLQDNLAEWLGAGSPSWEWILIVVLAAALTIAFVGLESEPARPLLAAGLATWLTAQLVDELVTGSAIAGHALVETLEMAAAGIVFVAVLATVKRRPPAASPPAPSDWRAMVVRLARACDPRSAVLLLTAAVVVTIGIGSLVHYTDAPLPPLGLLGEFTLVSYVNATMLAVAAALAFNLPAGTPLERLTRAALATLFAVMAAGELLEIHEKFDHHLGIPGQVAYVPFLVAGGLAWLAVLRRIWSSETAGRLLVAGAVLWAGAQAIDVWSVLDPGADEVTRAGSDADAGLSPLFMNLIPLEETLETFGTGLIAIGLALAIRELTGRRADREAVAGTEQIPAPAKARTG